MRFFQNLKSPHKITQVVVVVRFRWISAFLILLNVVILLTPFVASIDPIKENTISSDVELSIDYPTFVAPSANTSTLENGTINLSGTNIHWRLFTPNSSISYQDPNFWMTFDIRWESLESEHYVSIELAEVPDGSSNHMHIGTGATITEVILDSEDNFLQYSEWYNGTYYYTNQTKKMFTDNLIYYDSEKYNLTVSVWNFNYHRLFSHEILVDNKAPVPQVIHQNYNGTSNELQLDWNLASYQVNITDRNRIHFGGLIALYTNMSTSEEEQFALWESYDIQNGEITEIVIPIEVLEQYMVASGSTYQDPLQIDTEFLLIDNFLNFHRYELSIYIDRPNATSTTTTDPDPLNPLIPIVGVISIVGIAVIVIVAKRVKK